MNNSTLQQSALLEKQSAGPEDEIIKMEKEINTYLEESSTLSKNKDYRAALDKAKLAVKKKINCRYQMKGDCQNIEKTII